MPVSTLTHNIGGALTDLKKTKSQIGPFIYYCDDLVGCGELTHARVAKVATFRTRQDCGPIYEHFGFSFSGLFNLDEAYSRYPSFVQDLVAYITNNALATTPQAPTSGDLYSFRGTEWVSAQDDGFRDSYSLVRIVPAFDQCDAEVGLNYSASRTLYLADTVTCKPTLAYQASLSIYMNTGIGQPYLAANLIQDIGMDAENDKNTAKLRANLNSIGVPREDCSDPFKVTQDALATYGTLPYEWKVLDSVN